MKFHTQAIYIYTYIFRRATYLYRSISHAS